MPSKEVSFWNVSELVIALMSVRTLSSRLITTFREDCVPFSTLFSSVRLVPSCVRILFNCSVVAGTPFSIPFSSPVRLETIRFIHRKTFFLLSRNSVSVPDKISGAIPDILMKNFWKILYADLYCLI